MGKEIGMRLSKRLEMVASFVERGSRVADIGTDHGFLPIVLVERGICPCALAMDVREGPLKRAREHVREHGLDGKVECRLSDGLAKLKPGEADTAVMAGMGGELIVHILEQGRDMWEHLRRVVLSPQSEMDKVRRYLEEEGFSIEREDMVVEDGKFYVVMGVGRGRMKLSGQAQYLYGKRLIEERNPVLARFLLKEEERIRAIFDGFGERDTDKVRQAKRELAQQLEWIKEAQDEMQGNYRAAE